MDHFGRFSEHFACFFMWPNILARGGVGCVNAAVLVFMDFTAISELN